MSLRKRVKCGPREVASVHLSQRDRMNLLAFAAAATLNSKSDLTGLFFFKRKKKKKNRSHSNEMNRLTRIFRHESRSHVNKSLHDSSGSEEDSNMETSDSLVARVSDSSGSSRDSDNATSKMHDHPTVGDFQFLSVIGKGSFGKVMLAKYKNEATYAVKVLEKKMILKKNEKAHMMCEKNVLIQNLHHPFLIGLRFSFQSGSKLYLVLDYVNGGELFFHLQNERTFPEPRARFYAAEITSALGYLHSKDIIYRDLKPENILLDSEGHIVLTDFGLCKDGIGHLGETNTFCGTPEYLAPEVIQKKWYTRTVDWWCLGAVLYEMLYGLPPFYSRDTNEMYDNILHKPVRVKSNITVPARDLLEKLLDKDKETRLGAYRDVDEIKEHEFFSEINWDDLEKKKISPPFNPNVKDPMDLKNIDREFLREPVPASIARSTNFNNHSSIPSDAFYGFSFSAGSLNTVTDN